jgi:hypothetical protein
MFFWKIKELKNALIRRELSEGQVFGYVLIFVLLNAVAVEVTRYSSPEYVGVWDYINSFFGISIVLWGAIFSYRANGGSSGVDFAARFLSISLVVLIRHMFFIFPIALIFYVYIFYSSQKGVNTEQVIIKEEVGVGVVLFVIWYINIYQSVIKNIREVARA